MKKLLLFLLLSCPLFAQDWDDELFQIENAPPPFFPFSVSGDYIDVSKATFNTPGLEDSDLKYKQWDVAFAYTHPFSEICGLIFGAGWVGTEVDMKNNPDFNETVFNYINFSIGAFSKAFPDWTWTVTLAAFLDLEELSLIDYTLYQGVLWGRYELCKWLEFDVGVILEVGLDKEKAWPIIGFIYLPCDKWRINAIYPINVAIEYDIFPCLTAAGSIRFLRNRHRVKEDEPNSQGIFEYYTTGAEGDLKYAPFKWFFVKGFAGYTLGGDFKISDRNDKNSTHFKFNGSFYAGASAVLSF